jgi:lipoate-protein ligase A
LFNNCNSNFIDKAKSRITSINDELNKEIDYNDIKSAMKKGFEKSLKIEFIEDKLSEKELKLAEKLERNKYSNKNWNYLR